MTQGRNEPESRTAQEEARNAIAAFLEILDVFPSDADTLDALAQSYHLLGEADQELRYLKRLIRVLLEQGDLKAAGLHSDRLLPLAGSDLEAQAILAELQGLGVHLATSPAYRTEGTAGTEARVPPPPLEDRSALMDAEMELAWALKEAGIFSEEDYAGVIQDLSEVSGNESVLTVSVLHVLQDRSSRCLDPALSHVVRQSRRPLAPVEHLELNEDAARMLPVKTMIVHGVAVFDQVGPELLVAAVNPLRKQLRERLEHHLSRPCHLFAVHPATFDGWIARVQQALKENPE